MPKPRREWFPEAVPFSIESTPARQRRGGRRAAIPAGYRNGLPVRLDAEGNPVWYAYAGTGEDILLGSYGDERLDTPDDF